MIVTVDSAACETVRLKGSHKLLQSNQQRRHVITLIMWLRMVRRSSTMVSETLKVSMMIGIKLVLQCNALTGNFMSVHQIVAAGNYVHFEKDNSHVYNYNTGFRTIMDEVNRQYAFDM